MSKQEIEELETGDEARGYSARTISRPVGQPDNTRTKLPSNASFESSYPQRDSAIEHAPPLPRTNYTSQCASQSEFSGGNSVSYASFSSSILQEEAKVRWDSETELRKVSKSLLRLQKWSLIIGLCSINGILIYVAWKYSQVYYVFIVLLSSNTMLQAVMILCILAYFLIIKVLCACRRKKEKVPESPEKLVMLLPCYNETYNELTRSLQSLVDQKKIDGHPRVIFIVVDGDVKGPGMEKTTQEYLLQDILEPGSSRFFANGYRARDGLFMPVKIQTGYYKGTPYLFVGKRYNQGKRDSLCFARSFLYHFVKRSEGIMTIFNQDLFDYLGNFFFQHGLEHIDYLVGMDADTVFDDYCVYEMIKEIRKNPKTVGVCGHVCVDFEDKPFGFWSLYQSVEYSQTQGLRRMFQSRITGKVNCLPGRTHSYYLHELGC
jgi:chitin synthase